MSHWVIRIWQIWVMWRRCSSEEKWQIFQIHISIHTPSRGNIWSSTLANWGYRLPVFQDEVKLCLLEWYGIVVFICIRLPGVKQHPGSITMPTARLMIGVCLADNQTHANILQWLRSGTHGEKWVLYEVGRGGIHSWQQTFCIFFHNLSLCVE